MKLFKKKLKKKVIYKKKTKKKFFKILLKKKRKKLNVFYKMFNLEFYSIFYKKMLLRARAQKKRKKDLLSISKKKKLKKKKEKRKFILNFFIRVNNIFINLVMYYKRKYINIKFWSAGIFDLVCSKKRIKFVITNILKNLKLILKKIKLYIIQIKGPKYFTKILYKNLKKFAYKSSYIFICSFKIFNGCRFKKLKRKKHLKYRAIRFHFN